MMSNNNVTAADTQPQRQPQQPPQQQPPSAYGNQVRSMAYGMGDNEPADINDVIINAYAAEKGIPPEQAAMVKNALSSGRQSIPRSSFREMERFMEEMTGMQSAMANMPPRARDMMTADVITRFASSGGGGGGSRGDRQSELAETLTILDRFGIGKGSKADDEKFDKLYKEIQELRDEKGRKELQEFIARQIQDQFRAAGINPQQGGGGVPMMQGNGDGTLTVKHLIDKQKEWLQQINEARSTLWGMPPVQSVSELYGITNSGAPGGRIYSEEEELKRWLDFAEKKGFEIRGPMTREEMEMMIKKQREELKDEYEKMMAERVQLTQEEMAEKYGNQQFMLRTLFGIVGGVIRGVIGNGTGLEQGLQTIGNMFNNIGSAEGQPPAGPMGAPAGAQVPGPMMRTQQPPQQQEQQESFEPYSPQQSQFSEPQMYVPDHVAGQPPAAEDTLPVSPGVAVAGTLVKSATDVMLNRRGGNSSSNINGADSNNPPKRRINLIEDDSSQYYRESQTADGYSYEQSPEPVAEPSTQGEFIPDAGEQERQYPEGA